MSSYVILGIGNTHHQNPQNVSGINNSKAPSILDAIWYDSAFLTTFINYMFNRKLAYMTVWPINMPVNRDSYQTANSKINNLFSKQESFTYSATANILKCDECALSCIIEQANHLSDISIIYSWGLQLGLSLHSYTKTKRLKLD